MSMTVGAVFIPAEEYHAHPALSSSGARKLLPPSCPARYKWERDNPPEPPKRVFEIGSAGHAVALGTGPELVLIDADEWRTKAVKAEVAEVRERGAVPLKPAEYQMVHAMADAIREHPIASVLFDPERGKAEQSLFWHDTFNGVDRRARLDWLPDLGPTRLIVPDYKTSHSADLRAIRKSIFAFGYHQQAAWYLDGIAACGLADDAAFLFVVQEKEPPYLVTVVELDGMSLTIGRHRNRRAIDLYAECLSTDTWPGYSTEVELIEPPRWAEFEFLEEIA